MIRDVIQRKVQCQLEEDSEDLDDDKGEIDKVLIENAGERAAINPRCN